MATIIYRVRLDTASETLARKYGEHFYTEYANATRKQEQLLREMQKHRNFDKRGMATLHEESAGAILDPENQTISRRRFAGVATRLEDGSRASCEHVVCTPWVEITRIQTEDL